ncbi:hypothetical protein B0A50_06624 [Salinomyces thailandicus]|uniref:Uncharacterized protein n=1 Tax=Salinomyces thailandicus TaxID=706561 RepID=A0A4U0TQZ6_9PEZI|nr:hypothetical protein B0A50_06624 [Salinomyces thailandica]
MTNPATNGTLRVPPTDRDPPRSLAGIGFNSILANDQGTSSEDELADGQRIQPEDARTAIGVSISQEQTRLISPRTPAVEKQAAIEEEGGFFGGAVADLGEDGTAEEPAVTQEAEAEAVLARPPPSDLDSAGAVPGKRTKQTTTDRVPVPQSSEVRLPSPWRSQPKRNWQTRSVLRDGRISGRKRSSSGPDTMLGNWQKAFMSSLPSVPKNFLPFQSHDERVEQPSLGIEKERPVTHDPIASSWNERQESPMLSRHPSDSDSKKLHLSDSDSTSREKTEADGMLGDRPANLEFETIRSRPSQLRRSTSDNSMITHRTMSRVSSLGDDSRWDNVQEQVNSRVKAIRDSWQDSNIRLPSLPSISFRADFFRERSNSHANKQSHESSPKPTDPMTRTPYHSTRAAMNDANPGRAAASHPHFNNAMEQLEGDVVILGGYRGSILRSAEPPHRQVWVPIKVGLNIRKVDLEVGLEEDADERATEKIIPGGMLSHIGPVDISRRLFKRLRNCENARSGKLRVRDWGYDWRLSPTYLSKQLQKFLESLPSNQPGVPKEKRGALVVAHSLGGLITRHAVNQRPELFSGVVYAGVPNTCVNILGPMRNGDEVLLSSRVLTAQVNFTIRTSFALLPLDGRCFFDKETKEEYHVDFFDPQTWIDYRLSPCVARPLPPLNPQPKSSGLTGYVSSVTNSLPSFPMPGRKNSISRSSRPSTDPTKAITASGAAEPDLSSSGAASSAQAQAEGNIDPTASGGDPGIDQAATARTAVTLSRDQAYTYLARTLASVKKFKQQLAYNPEHSARNAYPPVAVIYGKSTPTVYGAKVSGREGIKHADAYDELAFASGDGVVLARAAMVPEGYRTVRGGVVSSDRGHITLLGDLEVVGRCLEVVIGARRKGVGLVDRKA